MDLDVNELKLILLLLDREQVSFGLSDEESELMNKLEKRYKELGGYVKEDTSEDNFAPWEDKSFVR
ncbi:hypothetical protein GRF59_14795 [Paenibacillus sp. HJL G12]|uniref:Uncharacterized protein n=1 Tax=Paenibacillus dendrobii TaxID=2691084 RepID=A0A7X3LH87_9BACL|nr:hypothetical protein [Paenibacillus dendrobii]MWV44887.1 hypothetical protein [Paenibacillus dendrobii]